MKKAFGTMKILTGALCVGLILIMTGCATLGPKSDEPTDGNAIAEKEDTPKYLDFGDVLLPIELKVDKKASFVFKANGQSVGLLTMKGRVEMDSLIAFFENNMTKDNWRMVSYFKSMQTLMLFQKNARWCVVKISDGDFSTNVEVWVCPTVGETSMELMN